MIITVGGATDIQQVASWFAAKHLARKAQDSPPLRISPSISLVSVSKILHQTPQIQAPAPAQFVLSPTKNFLTARDRKQGVSWGGQKCDL